MQTSKIVIVVFSLLLMVVIFGFEKNGVGSDIQSHCCPFESLDSPIRTYIIAGQSNASPMAPADNLNTAYENVQPCVFYYKSPITGIEFLEPGVNSSTISGVVGLEASLGYSLYKKYQEPILLFRYSIGGSALVPNPFENKVWSVGKQEHILSLRKNMGNLMLEANANGKNLSMEGMVWVQGEKDSGYGVTDTVYREELTELVEHTRNFLGTPDMPVSIVRINASHDSDSLGVAWIRKAQEDFTAMDPYAFLINMDDFGYDPNSIPHYTAEGYWEMGIRAADPL